jgi:protein tyrosine phosphatase (PTP) superfamily phosphohydrolase (DUF442 family)
MSEQDIKNDCEADALVSMGGQPTEDQLRALAHGAVQVVINLAPINPRYSLEDEAASVRALGMAYHHIPFEWSAPTPGDFASFEAILSQLSGQRVFIHCAANFRATAFYGLYALKRLGWSDAQAN